MLQMRFFGTPTVDLNGQVVPELTCSPLLTGLFAYLIMHRNRSLARLVVASLFWPNLSEQRARRNLNNAIWELRQALRAKSNLPRDYLLSDSQNIRFNTATSFWLDVAEFEASTACLCQRRQAKAHLDDEIVRSLEQAIELYRGDFLEGMYQDWCEPIRVRLREQYLLTLETLIVAHRMNGASEAAMRFAQQLTQADPLREEAYYHLIQLCTALGRTHEARTHYQQYEAIWREELKSSPSARMQALFQQLAPATGISLGLLDWGSLEPDIQHIKKMVAATRRSSGNPAPPESRWSQIADASERVGLALKVHLRHEEALRHLTLAIEAVSHLPPSCARNKRELALRRVCDELYDLQANRKGQTENLQRASQLAEELGDISARADSLARQAWLAREQGDHARAIALLQQMLGLCQGNVNQSHRALAYRLLGIVHDQIGDYQAALEAHSQALVLDEALNNSAGLCLDFNNLATTLRHIGNYSASLKHLLRAQALLTPETPLLVRATLMGNLGNLWIKFGDWTRSADHLREAMGLVLRAGDREAECWLGNKLALLHQRRGEKGRALQIAQHYYSMAEELETPQRRTELAERLANLCCDAGEGRAARDWAERAEALAQTHGFRRYLLRSRMRRAQACLVLNEAALAFNWAQEALAIFEAWNQPTEDEAELLWIFARSARAVGDETLAAAAGHRAGVALLKLADWIADPERRAAFLKTHPVQWPKPLVESILAQR